jgi:hypothetical protein
LLLRAKHLFVAAMVALASTGTGAVDRFRRHATKSNAATMNSHASSSDELAIADT